MSRDHVTSAHSHWYYEQHARQLMLYCSPTLEFVRCLSYIPPFSYTYLTTYVAHLTHARFNIDLYNATNDLAPSYTRYISTDQAAIHQQLTSTATWLIYNHLSSKPRSCITAQLRQDLCALCVWLCDSAWQHLVPTFAVSNHTYFTLLGCSRVAHRHSIEKDKA